MKKIILFLFISLSLYALKLSRIESELIKIEPNFGYIKDDEDILIGASGVVVQKLANFESIVARVSVIERKDGLLKLGFKVFSSLKQRAMPTPILLPKKGDKVVINHLYDRALIIAPNKKSYEALKEELKETKIISSDLLAAFLISNYSKVVSRKLLRSFCGQSATGLIALALKEEAFLYDCQDLKKLSSFKLKARGEVQRPFYTNIKQTRGSLLELFDDENMRDYYSYYKELFY